MTSQIYIVISMRYQYIDILRGVCIVLMVVFHFNYSLIHIFWVEFLNFSEIFWFTVWKTAALWFMTIAGISYFLASRKYPPSELRKKYMKYAAVLWVIALWISGITYLIIPDQLILFGILHFFAISFLILPVITRNFIVTSASLIFIIWVWNFIPEWVESEYLFPFWFVSPNFSSADYYPIIPYLWMILMWYIVWVLGEKYWYMKLFHVSRSLNTLEKLFSNIWKKSLLIYLIHQPVIILSLYIFMELLFVNF